MRFLRQNFLVQDKGVEPLSNGSQPLTLSIELILYIVPTYASQNFLRFLLHPQASILSMQKASCSFLAIQAVFQAYGNPLIHHNYVAYFDFCQPRQWLHMNCLDSAYFIAWQMLKDLNLSFFIQPSGETHPRYTGFAHARWQWAFISTPQFLLPYYLHYLPHLEEHLGTSSRSRTQSRGVEILCFIH